MSQVVSLRLREAQMERLRRVGRRINRTPSEAAALLLEEALRTAEFAAIQFRDSAAGRQAYIQGSSLAVWEVVSLARSYGGDVTRTAEHLGWPESRVRAALNYAAAYPDEIEAAIQDNAVSYEELARLLPGLERLEVEGGNDIGGSGQAVVDTPDEASAR